MKALILLILLIFSSLTNATINPLVFNENYPKFQNYQTIIFSKLNDYFESLTLNSTIYVSQDGIRTYKIKNATDDKTIIITSKITREKTASEINEHIIFYLENSISFSYDIKKKGTNVIATDDDDLLNFRLNSIEDIDYYQINIPSFKIQISHTKLPNNEQKSFFSLGFMEFNVQLESHFQDHEASLTYLYFYKWMPNPQSALTVRAIENNSNWSGIRFIHIGSNAGEITPKQFFQGLAEGASAFEESADIISMALTGYGFPKLN
jgi:hypothetical protein